MHRQTQLATAGAAAAVLAMMSTACGSDEADPAPTSAATSVKGNPVPTSAVTSVSADPAPTSAVNSEFMTTRVEGNHFIVGHAIKMLMPSAWVIYSPERSSQDQTTYEWAAGLPEGTEPLPAGVQFSMGISGKGAQIGTLPAAAKQLAEGSAGYTFLGAGDADVPGAQAAKSCASSVTSRCPADRSM